MKSQILGMAACLLLVCFGSAAQGQPAKLSADAKTVAVGNNVFALNLYSQLRGKDGNLFFSPYSISSALSMTNAGARGKTAEEMAATLHFSLAQDRLHNASGELVKYFNAKGNDRPYQLSVANALWGQKGFNFLPEFKKLTEEKYGAKFAELDFVSQTEQARRTINGWVEKETNNKIKELLQKGILNENTRLVLTNAIYFKSPWANKFWKGGTKEEDFTLSNGKKVKVPMMVKGEETGYADAGTFQIATLPYKDGGLSMIVLLPKKANGLAALEKELTSANLDKWVKKMTPHQVSFKLPKFTVTAEFNLNDQLKAMGMELAFKDNADFSGMSSQAKLKISAVIHKAFVDVHEEGTEAAAATAVIIAEPAAPPPLPPADFHADHPFFFLIRDNQTGSILFMGRVTNPKE